MRVLHVISGLAPRSGGPSVAVAALCRELAKRNVEVAIYTTDFDGKGELDVDLRRPVARDGVQYRYFAVQSPRFYKFSAPLARALRENIRSYDLVHIHSLYLFPSTIAAHYCRRCEIPYIVGPHGSLDPAVFFRHRWRKSLYERLIEWRNLEAAAAVHFTSLDEQRQADRLGLRIKGAVVSLGVDPPGGDLRAITGRFRAAHPETEGKPIVLYLGRLNFKKGLDILVRAFALLRRTHPNAHLVLAGPDDEGYGRKVKAWLREAGVLQNSSFTGLVEGDEKTALLTDADVFVLPSSGENFGIAAAEAMAHGLPVVVSNRVGIWREVAESGAGIVVNCDANEVAEALQAVLEYPALACELGNRGRRLAADKFSWGAAATKLAGLYERIMAGDYPEV